MSPEAGWLWSLAAPFALVVARIAPVAFLCPVLGGAVAPPTVRLGVALALAAFVTGQLPKGASPEPGSATAFVAALTVEALLGLGLGLLASAPFDAARVGGRLIDLVRGSSAEAALPLSGSRETASGDLLYQLLVALAAAGAVVPAIVSALCRSFAAVPAGSAAARALDWEGAAAVTGRVLSVGLAIAAPAAVACLLVDLAIGLAGRFASAFHLHDQLPGARLLVGAIAFWAGVGATASALLDESLAAAASFPVAP